MKISSLTSTNKINNQVVLLSQFLLITFIFTSFVACKKEEKRFSLASVRVLVSPGSKEKIGFIQKSEKVYLLPGKDQKTDWSKIKLSDGSLGYVASKYLAPRAVLINSPSVDLKRRPSLTAPSGYGAQNIGLASIAFILQETQTKEEGVWLKVKGGYKSKHFQGWLAADTPFNEDLKSIRLGILLEQAIINKKREDLEKLVSEKAPVGEVAATFLAQLYPEEEEQEVGEESYTPRATNDKNEGSTDDSEPDPSTVD